MKSVIHAFASVAAATLLAAAAYSPANAASVSYFLDQSDKLADGVNYLQVTISDGENGAVNFRVEALQPLLDLAGNGTGLYAFGIDKFAFNVVPDGPWIYPDNVQRPPQFVFGPNQPMGDFGQYTVRLRTTNYKDVIGPVLEFSIIGIDFDTLATYIDFAINSLEGPSLFAAHLRGLDLGCDGDTFSPQTGGSCKPAEAFFGGAQIVPVPAAVWLFASALAALGGRRLMSRRSV
jgi:hypothetical protein